MIAVFTALLTGMFLVGVSSVSFALDLGTGKGNVESAEATLKSMTTEGEAKVKEAKGEEKEESMAEKIQSKSKEKIDEKIDDMKSGFPGK
jgi:hypothetical protein